MQMELRNMFRRARVFPFFPPPPHLLARLAGRTAERKKKKEY